MPIYATKTERMDITFDLSSKYIFVQQKWRYNWINEEGANPWTLEEKRNFHNKADQWIWSVWSSQAYAVITGNSKLAIEYRNTKFKINIDIKWVVGRETEHWAVDVTKIDRDAFVIWNLRRINLKMADVDYSSNRGVVDNSMRYLQTPVAHEFGHSFGNTRYVSTDHGDEYEGALLSRYADDGSIMSAGNAVRLRHFDYLKNQLIHLINNSVEVYLF